MTDQKPKCPPCHGNCGEGRQCTAQRSEAHSFWKLYAAAVLGYFAVCTLLLVLALAYSLVFGGHAQ